MESNLKLICQSLQDSRILLETKTKILCRSQVLVFDQQTGNIIEMIPPNFDDSLRQLFFVGIKVNSNVIPTAVITNIIDYFEKDKFGFFCFYCKKRFSGKGTKHRCRQRRSCFCCHRPILNPSTFINKITKELYCMDEMEPKISSFCPQCNLSIRNNECKQLHNKFVCRWGWFCLVCKKYTFRSKYVPTLKLIIENHNCDSFICTFCGERIKHNERPSHLCPIQTQKPQMEHTKLAFVQLSYTGRSRTTCNDCFETEITCNFCQDQEIDQLPNIGVLLLETQCGHFDSYVFADFNLFDHVKYEKNCLVQKYAPRFFLQKERGQRTCFNQTRKIVLDKNYFFQTSSFPIIEQILQFMLTKDFSNTTVLINCNETNDLFFLYRLWQIEV